MQSQKRQNDLCSSPRQTIQYHGNAWQRVREERPDYQLYNQDLSHPSPLGTYLAATVIYTTLFPAQYQSKYTAGFEAEKAEYIQQAAQKTVLENKAVINLK